METKRKLDPQLRRYAPHPQQWVRKVGILPHPRVHPTNQSIEDFPEDLLEELPHDRAEEETLSNAEIHQENKRRVQVQMV
ncbi:hypothetical protein CapIbe_014615 [Capra ibex]